MTRLSTILIYSAQLITLGLAAIDCNGNVTITNAQDAEEIRSSCTSIQGNLVIHANISDSVNLDGLEEVKGNLLYRGECGYYDRDGCDSTHALLELGSSTLRAVRGDLTLYSAGNLGSVSLPKLNVVNGSVDLGDLWNVTSIDVTNLEYSNTISLWVPNLEEFKMNGLKGFTYDDSQLTPKVYFSGTTSMKSVDAFFQNPVEQVIKEYTDADNDRIWLSGSYLPNVRHVTFGWKRAVGLVVNAADMGLTLGGVSSESMELGSLEISNNLTSLERGPKMKNLTVGSLDIHARTNVTGDLVLPFHQISSISVFGEQIRSVQLPVEAEQWNLTTLLVSLASSDNLFNASNSKGEKIWHWPKNNIETVQLSGNLTAELFTDLIQSNTNVSKFSITDTSGELDCSIFDDIQSRFGEFLCRSQSLGTVMKSSWLGILFSTAVVLLVI